ncbi:MAG TPA: glycine cleavage T C-terminal barrel domain-containing protein [Longimicrobiales bacterium]|nr:glycine cleavage T C-terminal barrel domain-containing protein [Longimicrobiales bacterium]
MIAPTAEYTVARSGAALVERDDRVQLRAHGRDPVRMIQGLITNDLEGATIGRAVYASLLTPKGRMIADLRAIRQPDGSVLLDLDAGALEGTLAHLKKMVPPLFARFETPAPPLRVLGVYGPAAASVLRDALDVQVDDDEPEDRAVRGVAHGADFLLVATREAGVSGFDVFVAAEDAAAVGAALRDAGARPASAATLDVLRIEAGRPRWGAELDADRIPLEAGLLERGISTTKGCYTGQEVIVRILHRGHVNWQLRGLLLGAAPAPARGTELALDEGGKTVARITSATASPALGQTVALAYVRREIEPGTALRMQDGTAARVVALPFDTRETT